MALSSSGIGSGLDIEGLISQLMAAEAAPLKKYQQQTATYQSKIDALGKVSAAVASFQTSVAKLSSVSAFSSVTANATNGDVLKASAGSSAAAGSYRVTVNSLAQSHSLNSAGQASMTSLIGSGGKTTLTFQFGAVSNGNFGIQGSALNNATATNGIANGSLSINGVAIATGSSTRSAKDLAAAINAQSASTGVSAVASATSTDAGMFGNFASIDTTSGGSYALSVGGVTIAAQAAGVAGGAGISAASLDAVLSGHNQTTQALSAAGISWSGTAAGGDLQFHSAEGNNIAVSELVDGAPIMGGLTGNVSNNGSLTTATSDISLVSKDASQITIGGKNPELAGLLAGANGNYLGASFEQDGAKPSGTVTLDTADMSLQGIRDAINKANIGVQASIISDGSAEPYRLVLTSTSTGEKSSMKISLSAEEGASVDPALKALLEYDPAGVQGMKQTSAAQSASLYVNGVAVKSDSNSVSEAIEGVTIDVKQLGSSSITVARDSSTIKSNIDEFVKAYNTLNTTMKSLTNYNAETKTASVLAGDSTVRSVQSQLRNLLNTPIAEGKFSTLNEIGVEFKSDGSLSVNSTKLSKAMTDNMDDVSALFAAVGHASDSMIKFSTSSAATVPGTYGVNITQLASKGNLTSSSALGASTTIDANTTWVVTLNQTDPVSASKTATVSLAAGTYSPEQLAALLRAAINGESNFAENGDSVETAIGEDGKLSLSSSKWGAASNISIESLTGTSVASIFGSATATVGTDVAGTIGGAPATGNGKTLSAAAGSKAEGLQIEVEGGALGERGTISFAQGYAYQMNNLIASFLDKEGLLTARTDGINASIKSVEKQAEQFNLRLEATEKRYRTQYTALDVMLASMQSTSNYLTQQLAALAANS